jgi:hypothetical protein
VISTTRNTLPKWAEMSDPNAKLALITKRKDIKMSFIYLQSACGRESAPVDYFDLDLNPHGVICCQECETIIESREAWTN